MDWSSGDDADGGGRNGDLCVVPRFPWEVVPVSEMQRVPL
jgi:hypothetical protein